MLTTRRRFFTVLLLMLAAINCVASSYHRDLVRAVHRYQWQAHHDLIPEFRQAHTSYPPKKIALLVFKDERAMELWANDGQEWTMVHEFDILAASGRPGPKLYSGDEQVPEGIYQITFMNPYSKYDLSLKINYPDQFDQLHARLDHRKYVGGNICIHGKNVSVGCIAIGDHAIEDLFVLVYEVGLSNVEVIIAPNDLRVGPPVAEYFVPNWVSVLNQKLKTALQRFPVEEDEAQLQQT